MTWLNVESCCDVSDLEIRMMVAMLVMCFILLKLLGWRFSFHKIIRIRNIWCVRFKFQVQNYCAYDQKKNYCALVHMIVKFRKCINVNSGKWNTVKNMIWLYFIL